MQGQLLPALAIPKRFKKKSNLDMKLEKVFETRRAQLRVLIDAKFEGVDGVFADTIERPRPNVSQLLSGYRKMGEEIARDIEEKLSLPPYWLDGLYFNAEDIDLMNAINALPPDRKAWIAHYVTAELALLKHSATSQEIKDSSSRSRRNKP